ncbi:unnamed protein product [Closterium sp. NIES-54]
MPVSVLMLSSPHLMLDPSRPFNTTHIPHPPVHAFPATPLHFQPPDVSRARIAIHLSSHHQLPIESHPGFRSLLHLSAPRSNALGISGLPSFRPGMLAHCSCLHSLFLIGKPETISMQRERGGETGIGDRRGGGGREGEGGERGGGGREGEGDVEERVVLQQVSFESLVGMLVRVVQRGGEGGEGGEEGGEGGEVGGEEEGEERGEGGVEGGVEGRGEECEEEEGDKGEDVRRVITNADAVAGGRA